MFSTATMRKRADFKSNRLLQVLLTIYLITWVMTAINPLHPDDWLLENLLVFTFVPVLVLTHKRFPLSDLSYLVITVFMALHSIGAHYTYAEVPFGFWLQKTFNLSRNHYDRLIHLGFGLLIAYPIREIFLRVAHTKGFWAYYLPLDVTLAFRVLSTRLLSGLQRRLPTLNLALPTSERREIFGMHKRIWVQPRLERSAV